MVIHYSEYGNDIRIITDYLNEQGFYPDNAEVVNYLWKTFSDDLYFAGWIKVDEHTLREFVEYLQQFKGTYLVKELPL